MRAPSPKIVVYVCVYYEVIKRELKRRPVYECRCDERLKDKAEGSTRLTYTGLLGLYRFLMDATRASISKTHSKKKHPKKFRKSNQLYALFYPVVIKRNKIHDTHTEVTVPPRVVDSLTT